VIEFTPFEFAGDLLDANWGGGEPSRGLATFCALMTSSETLDKVVVELFELKEGTEDIDPEAVCNELFDADVEADDVARGPEMLWVVIGVGIGGNESVG
jgi:hypothetical protein